MFLQFSEPLLSALQNRRAVAGSYCPPESAGSGKLPVNGGRAAHKSVQLEAAIGSAGTGSAPVAALPVLRISMLLPPGNEVAR
jgi:hypothetical protein